MSANEVTPETVAAWERYLAQPPFAPWEGELQAACMALRLAWAERDAALAQLTSIKQQLAQTSATLDAERRAAAVQKGR